MLCGTFPICRITTKWGSVSVSNDGDDDDNDDSHKEGEEKSVLFLNHMLERGGEIHQKEYILVS